MYYKLKAFSIEKRTAIVEQVVLMALGEARGMGPEFEDYNQDKESQSVWK